MVVYEEDRLVADLLAPPHEAREVRHDLGRRGVEDDDQVRALSDPREVLLLLAAAEEPRRKEVLGDRAVHEEAHRLGVVAGELLAPLLLQDEPAEARGTHGVGVHAVVGPAHDLVALHLCNGIDELLRRLLERNTVLGAHCKIKPECNMRRPTRPARAMGGTLAPGRRGLSMEGP